MEFRAVWKTLVSSPPKPAFPNFNRFTALGGATAGAGAGGVVDEFVAGFDDEVVAPLVTVGLVVPVGPAEKSVLVDAMALAAEPIPLLHPQPHSARAIRNTKNRKNGDLRDWK